MEKLDKIKEVKVSGQQIEIDPRSHLGGWCRQPHG